MRVHVVDPPAYTPPYDRMLCGGLARAGAQTTLLTSRFTYGPVPTAEGFAVDEDAFYRHVPGGALRRPARLAQHVPDMLRYRRRAAEADVVHFQWLTAPEIDARLLPRERPVVLTAHHVTPLAPRRSQVAALRRVYARVDALVVHTREGVDRLAELGVPREKAHVIPHGAFTHLAELPDPAPLPADLAAVEKPVVLLFGLMRPYKGIDVALEAWRGLGPDPAAELWVVGMPQMDTSPLRAAAPPGVRFVERFVTDAEIPALFRRADLVLLPYRRIDQSGVLFTALAFGRPLVLSAVGGFPEVAEGGVAEVVPPGDADALRERVAALLADPERRAGLAARAAAAARERYGWDAIARAHLDLYATLARA